MARFVLLLPLLGVAAADVACPDGVCPSDADEHSALLQHRATQAVNISAQAGRACGTAWPLPDTTPHCGASPAGTCRGVRGDTMMCFRDTSGCTSSGGGMGCKAAGDVCPGMEQCRFCGTGGGAPDCPPAVACCLANTASCYACQAGMSEADLCKSYPDTAGCPSAPTPTPAPDSTTAAPTRPPPTPCCLAMTATCLACQAGVSVEEFCTAGPGNAQVAGCTSTGPYCSSPGSVAKGYFCEYKYDWNSASWDWYGCCRPYTWCTSAAPDGSQSVCMDYPVAAPMLAQVKIETTDCNVGGVAGKAVCPGSGNYCEGDQCCPGTEASNGSTFPCPSASDS